MNLFGIVLFLALMLALLLVPRNRVALPLLAGCCWLGMGQGVIVGGINLPVTRLLLFAGLLRVIARGERISGGMNGVDRLMIFWGAWTFFVSFFHHGLGAGPVFAMGSVLNLSLTYLLLRISFQDAAAVEHVIAALAILLLPVALEMLLEKWTGRNLFSALGAVSEAVGSRNGTLRAQGSFRNAIMAGTVGGLCLPLMFGIWHRNRVFALLGIATCLLMIFCSASSGPIMTCVFAAFALVMWRQRPLIRPLLIVALPGYVMISLFMGAPAYFLLARIDLTGSSTGWHRARLIQSSIEHLDEWWAVGTDHTRHWMASGIFGNPEHTDITNYYLQFGVAGGLVSMFCILAMIGCAFRWVASLMDRTDDETQSSPFMIWSLGASLFASLITGVSVSFDSQAQVFIWFSIAAISSLRQSMLTRERERQESIGDLVPSPMG